MLSFLQTEKGPRGTAPGLPLGSQSMPVSVSDQPAVCVPVTSCVPQAPPRRPGAPGAGRKGKDTRSPGPWGRTVAGPLCPCGACKSYAAKHEQRRKGRRPTTQRLNVFKFKTLVPLTLIRLPVADSATAKQCIK
jgi:hypothetical protein